MMSSEASDAEHDDAGREGEPVAAIGELAREEEVLGQHRGEAREGRERRVRGEHEDERRERQEQVEAELSRPKTRPATSAMTVVSMPGTMPKPLARNVMPTKRTASRTAMTASVVAAFRGSGGLNAGTPVAMASVPVRATAPEAKERMHEEDERQARSGPPPPRPSAGTAGLRLRRGSATRPGRS